MVKAWIKKCKCHAFNFCVKLYLKQINPEKNMLENNYNINIILK